MNVHSKYTDYKITRKNKSLERLEHITNSNRTIKIEYYKSGQIKEEQWLLKEGFLGKGLHRENGPAWIEYYESGQIQFEGYCLKNKWHRKDGPAKIWYDESGNITKQQFFLNGIQYTYTDFIQTPEYQAALKQQSQDIFD